MIAPQTLFTIVNIYVKMQKNIDNQSIFPI